MGMKYRISSYELQDGRWGPAFIPQQPISTNGDRATFSERTEFGVYFQTKEEADKYTHKYLIEHGALDSDIVEKSIDQNDAKKTFEL